MAYRMIEQKALGAREVIFVTAPFEECRTDSLGRIFCCGCTSVFVLAPCLFGKMRADFLSSSGRITTCLYLPFAIAGDTNLMQASANNCMRLHARLRKLFLHHCLHTHAKVCVRVHLKG
jgi:hypothetical protein